VILASFSKPVDWQEITGVRLRRRTDSFVYFMDVFSEIDIELL